MEFSYTESTDTDTNMVTKDYSKSRMRENCKYGSVRDGQSNLIPSTRLRGFRGGGIALRAISTYAAFGGSAAKGSENHTTSLRSLEMHPFPRLRRYFHLKVKRLTTFCASLALLQNVFAVHPGGGSLLYAFLWSHMAHC